MPPQVRDSVKAAKPFRTKFLTKITTCGRVILETQTGRIPRVSEIEYKHIEIHIPMCERLGTHFLSPPKLMSGFSVSILRNRIL